MSSHSERGNTFPPTPPQRAPTTLQVRELPIGLIDPDPGQPRREFETEKLLALAESIRSQGIHQPLHVVEVGERYQIEDGERRWRAARMAGLEAVPALVKGRQGWLATRLHQVLANALQEPLTPLEDAQALYLLWLGYQVEALEAERGVEGVELEAGTPVEQIAVLSARLCALAEAETVATYAGSGRVRVSWQAVLEGCGRGDWSADRRKKHLALLRIEPEVQAALAGVEVSGRTLRALATLAPEAQQALVAATRAESGEAGLGAALRAALERARERGDEAAFRAREAEELPPAPDSGSRAPHRPERGDLEETPERVAVATWPLEAVTRLADGLDTLLGLLDDQRDAAFDEGALRRITPLWAELTERLAMLGVQQVVQDQS